MNEAAEAEKTNKRVGLKIFLIIIAAIIAFAGIVVFGVYRDMNMYLYAELGDGAPDASAFMKTGSCASYKLKPDVSLSIEGKYFLTVTAEEGYSRKVLLIVKDTKAPQAEGIDKVITIDEKNLKPEDAISEIYDASDYAAEWVKEPVYGTAGSYDCSVLLRDSHGNEQVVKTVVRIIGLKELVVYEAGTEHPTLADFMIVERENAELLTDLNDIAWTKLGDNTVEVSFDGKTYTSILRITDTTAPVVDTVPAAVLTGGEVGAGSFVMGCTDATEVSYELSSKPDTSKTGKTSCSFKATDAAGNTAELKATLIVCDEIVDMEASSDTLKAEELMKLLDVKYKSYVMQSEPVALNSLGAHEVVLENVSGETVTVGVVVKDTLAPTAEGISCQCSTGYPCDAIKFLNKISDASAVKASFVTEPDWSKEGEQSVDIVLTDRAGNSTTIMAKAVISPDKTAPVIYGAKNFTAYAGAKPDYTAQVFAVDNADPNPSITVDSSAVDTTKAGVYEVSYTAKDHEGNSAKVTVKLTLIEKTVSDEKLNAEINKVAEKIFAADMTAEQKARAVFGYAGAIKLGGSSDGKDIMAAAYKGFTTGEGDSFTVYAVSRYLLLKAGIRVMGVERQSNGAYYWCLVDLGSGWYNFDPCNTSPDKSGCFMKTSDELKKINSAYWSFDTKIYPATELRPLIPENI